MLRRLYFDLKASVFVLLCSVDVFFFLGWYFRCWVWVFVRFVSTLRTSSLLHFRLSQLSCFCNKPQLGEMVAHMLRARISCRSPVVTFFILLDPIMESLGFQTRQQSPQLSNWEADKLQLAVETS